MRLQGLLSVCSKFRGEIIAARANEIDRLAEGSFQQLTSDESATRILRSAAEVMEGFVGAYPTDRDREAFERTAAAARLVLKGTGS